MTTTAALKSYIAQIAWTSRVSRQIYGSNKMKSETKIIEIDKNPTAGMLAYASWYNLPIARVQAEWAAFLPTAMIMQMWEDAGAAVQYVDTASRRMLIARLENMQKNGENSISIADIFALINDCDMLASVERKEQANLRQGE